MGQITSLQIADFALAEVAFTAGLLNMPQKTQMLKILFARLAGTQQRDGLWHPCGVIWPRSTIDGGKTAQTGTTWRRWRNGRWEYRHEPETADEWVDRQW